MGPGHSPPPNFQPICCGQKGCMDQDVTWYGARPRPRRLCVRWRPRSPSPKGGGDHPKFSAHVYCGQTAGCIKMPLGTDVGLSPGDFVLDGDPVPLPKKLPAPPQFSAYVYCGQTMDQDATWHEGRPQPRRLCVRWGPNAPPPQRR